VSLDVPPTRAPKEFIVCLVFRPTASSGVFLDYDSSTKGSSTSGVPGKPGNAFNDGDWMIRAQLDRPKGANPL